MRVTMKHPHTLTVPVDDETKAKLVKLSTLTARSQRQMCRIIFEKAINEWAAQAEKNIKKGIGV